MQRTCTQCSSGFEITDEDLAFYDKVSPVFNGKKELIPPPTQCPACRTQRRMAWRNHFIVYRNANPTPEKAAFSMWMPESSFPAYENALWFSDTWDQHASGMTVDLEKPFLPQFMVVHMRSPRFALDTVQMQNSDYSNNADNCKNCYLCFNITQSEDCIVCDNTQNSRDCIDCTRIGNCERCAECIDCERCYELQSSRSCDNCSNSFFLLNCRNCRNCIGCVNLQHKEYCIWNEQKTPEEYAAIAQMLSSHKQRTAFSEAFGAFALTYPQPHVVSKMTEDSTGNYLLECNDVKESFFIRGSEHVKYSQMLFDGVHHCQDITLFGIRADHCYEGCIVGLDAVLSHFCTSVWSGTSNMLYCTFCVSCSDCFGCTGLHHRKYCILNKQYTKDEYETLVPQIIDRMRKTGEWGEFFPLSSSPIPYNHSLAQLYFPLTEHEAAERGCMWHAVDGISIAQAIDAQDLPDGPPEQVDSLVIRSMKSKKAFKITSQEMKRYQQFAMPLPRTTYDERMEERVQKLGGIRLYDRTCAKTGKPIRTTIPPESPWIVWDREVWEQEFSA